MNLKILLNYPMLYKRIINNLDPSSRLSLSVCCKDINKCMNNEGYFKNITFKCDNLENYIKSLDLIDKHSRFMSTIIINNERDIFAYLPKGIETRYNVILKNCIIFVNDRNRDFIKAFMEKVDVQDCKSVFFK